MIKRVVWTVFVFALFSCFAFADTLNGSGSWQAAGWTPNNAGTQFFSNQSADGGNKNVGYCIAGGATSNCTMLSAAPGAIPYWAINPTTPDPFVTFAPTTGETSSLQVELAGFANVNQFGYTDSTGSHILFNGPASQGAVANFTAIGNYAFFIISGNGQTYSTDAVCAKGFNTTDCGVAHFAIFSPNGNSASGDFWLGAEDLTIGTLQPNGTYSGSSDRDYNDMIVHVTPIPEPGTLALLGSGLIGVAGVLRRKFSV